MQEKSAANLQMNNRNYNQSPTSSYAQQDVYNTNASGFLRPMRPSIVYPQAFNPMRQNQLPSPFMAQQLGFWNNPFNLPPSIGGTGGFNNVTSTSTPFDNSSSYGIISENYGG